MLHCTGLSEKPEDPDSAKAIANVLFTHHVTCENPKITRVIVCHPAMAGETSYPMTEQGAYIRLYGKKRGFFSKMSSAEDMR